MKIALYEISPWESEYIKNLLPDQEVSFFAPAVSDALLPDPSVEILSCFVGSHLTLKVLEALPHLKFIATRSTGFDHINLEACAARGVQVSNVPTYGENTVAEFTFALLLMVARKMYASVKRVREHGKFDYDGLRGFDLMGKTIGVVGTGHIGAHVIKIAHGFGMKILAADVLPNETLARDFGVLYVSLDDLLRQSDVITLHVPYIPQTHHLINSKNIGLIKKGAVLINTSRGALVETAALVEALRSGILSGAGLDVLEEEVFLQETDSKIGHPTESQILTVLADHDLMHMDNVVITPHNAFQTTQAMERILQTTVDNIHAFLIGSPVNTVKLTDK